MLWQSNLHGNMPSSEMERLNEEMMISKKKQEKHAYKPSPKFKKSGSPAKLSINQSQRDGISQSSVKEIEIKEKIMNNKNEQEIASNQMSLEIASTFDKIVGKMDIITKTLLLLEQRMKKTEDQCLYLEKLIYEEQRKNFQFQQNEVEYIREVGNNEQDILDSKNMQSNEIQEVIPISNEVNNQEQI